MGNGKKSDGTKPFYNAGSKNPGKFLKNTVLDLLYPRRCPVCHDIAVPRGRAVCRDCEKQLVPIKGPRCYKCSKPLLEEQNEYCYDCSSKHHYYDRGIGIFSYGSVIAKSLYYLKYHHRQEYGTFYGRYAAAYAGNILRGWKIQAVVPVPLHPARMRKRGYNQAERIGREIGEVLQVPVLTDLVLRKINTRPQKELNDRERLENLRNVFGVRQKNIPWKRVLVVDDIYTTGSTIDGVSIALKEHGVEKVYFLTIAIGTGF